MNKFYSMLGLGKRAGLVVGGETASVAAIKKKCSLFIISEDASDNTKKKFFSLCKNKNVKYVLIGTKNELGNSIGKSLISTIAITDQKFSENLMLIIDKMLLVNKLGGE